MAIPYTRHMNEQNALTVYQHITNPLDFIERFGEVLAKSGMTGGDRIEQGKVLAAACVFERKSPIQVLREYHIIDGRLSDRADAMLAKFRARGGKHAVLQRTPEEAAVELTIDGSTMVSRVSFEDLSKEPYVFQKDGKTLKKNYATPRARMQTLWARAVSDGVRTLAPEIVCGIYTPEEIADESATVRDVAPLLDVVGTKVEVAPVVVPASTTPARPSPPTTATGVAENGLGYMPEDSTPMSPAAVTSKAKTDTVRQLEAAIGDANAELALNWLKARGWIQTSLLDLTPKRAHRILANPEGFIVTVNGLKG